MAFIEDQHTELKSSFNLKEIAKTVVAFANTQGGKILIGVKDDGKVVGLDIGTNTLEILANDIARRTDPAIHPIILVKKKADKTYLEIAIEFSFLSPHFADHVAYKRVGKTVQKLSAQEIEQLIADKNIHSFDNMLISQAVIQDIDLSKVDFFLTTISKPYKPLQYLYSRQCFKKESSQDIPTVAGILLFGKKPQQFLVQAGITLVDYTKSVDPDVKHLATIEGTLFEQLDKVMDIIERVYPPLDILKLKDIKRRRAYRIPPEIIREVVVNSLIHRSYHDYGRKILLQLYSDKIRCTNPVKFRDPVPIEQLQDYQYSHNPILSRVFFEAGYIEEIGEGVDKILAWTSQTGNQTEPVYSYRHQQLTATLYLDKPDSILSDIADLSSRQKQTVKILSDGAGYSSSELANQLKISKDTVLKELSVLKKVIDIREEGHGRTTRYRWKK